MSSSSSSSSSFFTSNRMRCFGALVWTPLLFLDATTTTTAAATATATTSATPPHPVFAWLNEQPNAYIALEKMEFRQGGIFATQDISKGELLVVIPTNALFYRDTVVAEVNNDNDNDDDDSDNDDNEDDEYEYEYEYDIDHDDNVSDECVTAWWLVHDYHLGASSRFAPYVQYLFKDFAHEYLPLNWSRRAVHILQDVIVGTELLEPQDFGLPLVLDKGNHQPVGLYLQQCGYYYRAKQRQRQRRKQRQRQVWNDPPYNDDDDSQLLHELDAAMRIVIARGWEHVLVPVFDMFNHRNSGVATGAAGDWHNMDRLPSRRRRRTGHDGSDGSDGGDRRAQVDEEHRLVALRDIRAGEQLYNSYNQCHDSTCPPSIADTYVTPHILRDYGFVEQYPQRWRFDGDDSSPRLDYIVFELDQQQAPNAEEEEEDGSSFVLTWLPLSSLSSSSDTIPTDLERRNVLFNHWKRMVNLEATVQAETQQLLLEAESNPNSKNQTRHEVSVIWDYYHALTTALEQAVLAASEAAAHQAPQEQLPLEQLVASLQPHSAVAAAQDDKETETASSSSSTTCQTLDAQDSLHSNNNKEQLPAAGAASSLASSSSDPTLETLLQERRMAAVGPAAPKTTISTTTTTATTLLPGQATPSGTRSTLSSSSSSSSSSFPMRHYDSLHDDHPDALDYQFSVTDRGCDWSGYDWMPVEDLSSSRMSRLRFDHYYNPRAHVWNSCLQINEWLQSCTTFRPHYHEMVVHYPAQYILTDIRRVLFLGGGDVMILHEILKFPHLELVLGMELDPQVVRTSFRNSGISPQFEHAAVHWAFGDATKSLLMIPPEWYHTFDLVIVDLQNFVFDTVLVTPEWTIMDFVAQKLVHPEHGIVSRNDDFVRRRGNLRFAKHVVDVELHDVPRLCQQSLTMGSNGIDFLKVTNPQPHADDMVFFNAQRHNSSVWTNYRHDSSSSASSSSSEKKSQSKERDSSSNEDTNKTNVTDQAISFGPPHGILFALEVENATLPLAVTTLVRFQIRQALNQLDLVVETVQDDQDKRWIFATSATNASADAAAVVVNLHTTELIGTTMVFVLPNVGHVTVRAFPRYKYCAMDVLLWSRFQDQYKILQALVNAVGGQWQPPGASDSNVNKEPRPLTTSFYSTVATAPYGINVTASYAPKETQGEPTTKDEKEDTPAISETKKEPAAAESAPVVVVAAEENWEARVLVELTKSLSPSASTIRHHQDHQDQPLLWVVVCGRPLEDCHSLQTLQEHAAAAANAATPEQLAIQVVPLWACVDGPSLHSVIDNKNNGTEARMVTTDHYIRTMAQCELDSYRALQDATTAAAAASTTTNSSTTTNTKKRNKIAALVLDETVPYEMGQVVHKILNSTKTRHQLLGHSFLILSRVDAVPPPTASLPSPSWGSILLERVRTEMVQFNPVFHAELLVSDQQQQQQQLQQAAANKMPVGILSVGDRDFYHHLTTLLATIQTNDSLKAQVLDSKAGIVSYIPDFKLSKRVTTDDYDWTDAKLQWHSQLPLAHQSLYRFAIQLPLPPLKVGDRVLCNEHEHVWYGVWFSGRVTDVNADGTYNVRYVDGRTETMARRLLRKLDDNVTGKNAPSYKFGDRVLLHLQNFDGYRDVWYQASITGTVAPSSSADDDGDDKNDDVQYTLQIFSDSFDEQVASPSDMIYQMEPHDTNVRSEITLDKLEKLMKEKIIPSTLEKQRKDGTSHGPKLLEDMFENYHVTKVGEKGFVLSYLWSNVESVILVWDGETRLDVNLFTTIGEKEDEFRKSLEEHFLTGIPYLVSTSLDEQPRGIGRIVNTAQELRSFWFGQLDEYRNVVLQETRKNRGRVPEDEDDVNFKFGPSLE
ncbi:hypothetical protein ACA910_016478 [Epithemia clementina (nom. ined.)]